MCLAAIVISMCSPAWGGCPLGSTYPHHLLRVWLLRFCASALLRFCASALLRFCASALPRFCASALHPTLGHLTPYRRHRLYRRCMRPPPGVTLALLRLCASALLSPSVSVMPSPCLCVSLLWSNGPAPLCSVLPLVSQPPCQPTPSVLYSDIHIPTLHVVHAKLVLRSRHF